MSGLTSVVKHVFGAVDAKAHKYAEKVKPCGWQGDGCPELAVVCVVVAEDLFRTEDIVGAEREAGIVFEFRFFEKRHHFRNV